MSDETKQIKKIVDDEAVEQMVDNRFSGKKVVKRTGTSSARGVATRRKRKKKKNRTLLKFLITMLAFILVFVISFLIAFTYMSAPEQKSNKNDQAQTTNSTTLTDGSNEDKTFSSTPVEFDDKNINNIEEPEEEPEEKPEDTEKNEPENPTTSEPEKPSTPVTTPTTPTTPEPTTPSTPAPTPTTPDSGTNDGDGYSEGFVDGI